MKPILLSIADDIATITLNRPEKYNSVTRELALLFQEYLEECRDNVDVRVIIITGKGKAFCAGQDLGEIVAPDGPDIGKIIKEHFNPIVERIRAIEKPIIAAINGVAAGAGANLAIACDIAIAKESATFLQAFSAIGLIPDSGGTYYLPRMIGWQKAAGLMMLGEKIPAKEAERIGMIYQWVPDTIFASTVQKTAQKLACLPPIGLALTKRALSYSENTSLENQLRTEDQLQNIAGRTEDYMEAVSAFVEKRRPVFKGR